MIRLKNLFKNNLGKIIVGLLIPAVVIAGNSTFVKGPTLIESVALISTSGSTTTLTKDSSTNLVAVGIDAEDIVLPDATTIPVGRRFRLKNESTDPVELQYDSLTMAVIIPPDSVVEAILTDNATSDGTWAIDLPVDQSIPTGAVVFGTATGRGFGYDALNLFWDNTSNFLGIGTDAPDTALHVAVGAVKVDDLAGPGVLVTDVDGIFDIESVLSVALGGTNSGTALSNDRLMISSTGSIVEHSALTQGQVMYPNSSGLPAGSSNLFWDITNSRLGLGTNSPNERLDVSGGRAFRYSNDATTGNVDALTTTNISSIRFTGGAPVTLRGIAGGADGKEVTLTNVTGSTLTISNEHLTPTAANRIITGTAADLSVADGASVLAKYDATTSRWRLIGGSGGGGAGSVDSFLVQMNPAPGPLMPTYGYDGDPVYGYYSYPNGGTDRLDFTIKVPRSYVAGTQIFLEVPWAINSLIGDAYIRGSTLLADLSLGDPPSGSNNPHDAGTAPFSLTGNMDERRIATMELTDASGLIDGNPVGPGDNLKVSIYRGSDTSVADLKLLDEQVELYY